MCESGMPANAKLQTPTPRSIAAGGCRIGRRRVPLPWAVNRSSACDSVVRAPVSPELLCRPREESWRPSSIATSGSCASGAYELSQPRGRRSSEVCGEAVPLGPTLITVLPIASHRNQLRMRRPATRAAGGRVPGRSSRAGRCRAARFPAGTASPRVRRQSCATTFRVRPAGPPLSAAPWV